MPVLVPHTPLAALLGKKTIKSKAKTVGELLGEVESRVSPEEWVKAKKCVILLNGRSVHLVKGMSTPLAADDQVWLVFPACGG